MLSKTMAGGLVGVSILAMMLLSGGASAAAEEPKPAPAPPPKPPNPGPFPPGPFPPFPPPAPAPPPSQGGCVLDPNIPPEVAQAVNAMLTSGLNTADELARAAALCEQRGYVKAAACLRAAAKAKGGLSETPTASPCPLDAAMPAELAAATAALLRSPIATGAQLQQAAALANAGGYSLAAACLSSEAAKRGGLALPPAPPKVFALTIREGDIPFVWARHFTGDQSRWRELGDANPDILPLRTETSPTTGVPTTNYAGWRVGKKIRLPAGWDASRGKPPLAGPAPKPAPPPATTEAAHAVDTKPPAPVRPVPPTGGL